MMFVYCALLLVAIVRGVSPALIGYQCDSGLSINRTTISLIDGQDCIFDSDKFSEEKIKLALTQTSNFIDIKFQRCHAVLRHFIYRCGKSIDTQYPGGLYTEVLPFSESSCSELLEKGSITVFSDSSPSRMITGISKNTQYRHSYTSIGSIDASGSCSPGTPFTRNQYYFDRPVRNTEVEIIATHGSARVDFENNKIIFPNGVVCNYKGEKCEHADYGHLFWKVKTPDCQNDKAMKSLVYSGTASLITTVSKSNVTTKFIQAKQGDVHFQIQISDVTTYVCGFQTYLTEHPQLFATILSPGSPEFPLNTSLSSSDTNIMLYMGSKLVFIVRSMQDRIKELFRRFQDDRCYILNKINRQYMTTAILSPIEFAYQYFNEPGYTAVQRGEVIHVAKCTPVEVYPVALKPGECYKQLVVSSENKTMFMSARSRILTSIGTLLDCSKGVSSMFKLHDKWVIQSTEGLVEVREPQKITDSVLSYEFTDLTDIARGGIYTADSIAEMQKALVLPLEEEIISSRISMSIQSRGKLPEGYSFVNGFTPTDYESIKGEVLSWYDKMWAKFMGFGSFFAGVMAIAMIVKTMSWIVGTFVNFKILNDMFGCMGACMFAWWDSMAHHLVRPDSFPTLKKVITRSKGKKDSSMNNQNSEDDNIEITVLRQGDNVGIASAPRPQDLFARYHQKSCLSHDID